MFDQHRDLHRTTRGNIEHTREIGVLDLDGNVGFQLTHQALTDRARSDMLAFLAGKRSVVDRKLHLHGRRVDLDKWQRHNIRRTGKRFTNVDTLNAGGHADDAACGATFRVMRRKTRVAESFHHLRLLLGAVLAQQPNRVALFHAATEHLADRDTADIIIPLDVGNEHRKWRGRIGLWLRDELDDFLEQRNAVLFLILGMIHEITVARGTVNEGRVELVFGRVEVEEKLQHLVADLERIGERAVDLVDHHDWLEALRQRLAQNEARLRLRSAKGINNQQHAIDHLHHAFDLGTEVGVTRSIDDVDRVTFPVDRGVLGLDGDALLTLEVHRVHGAFGDGLVFTVSAAGLKELVDEGGLAVINVGNDGEVADIEGHGMGWPCGRTRGYASFLGSWQGVIEVNPLQIG